MERSKSIQPMGMAPTLIHRYPVADAAARRAFVRDLTRLISAVFSSRSFPNEIIKKQASLLESLLLMGTTHPNVLAHWTDSINFDIRQLVTYIGYLYEGKIYNWADLDEITNSFNRVREPDAFSRYKTVEREHFVLDLSETDSTLAALIKSPEQRLTSLEDACGKEIAKQYGLVSSTVHRFDRIELNKQEKNSVASLKRGLCDLGYCIGGPDAREEIEDRLAVIHDQAEELYSKKRQDTLASMRAQTASLKIQIATNIPA